ncbi:tripeptide aminopeptidase [Dethiosulfatibacter aminovorans DSM 17477]|uniref:Tripeptide aminopeptidase n=1 Tax=Dethiosulfatibacter aminovorans DSM 17477 TaxID=1121476 RepID=A0A1M6BMS8_9FIRM|nr:M20/M25/M40 family metallo-hydrolase [Dethiosulfatibacter aminovorans]SHI49858.1 tripeptide aminopeptidase [Dethiosulfatibacter aminovorans DSM 17477]
MFNEQEIVGRFTEYVKTASETGCEGEFYERLIDDLEKLGAAVTVDDAGEKCGSNANNIYAWFEGDESIKPLIFSCHMDTVKPGKDIETIIEDGMIKSKGDTILGSDDKSGITAIMEAMKAVKDKDENHRPIQIIFTISEEGGLKGSKNLDFKRLVSDRCYVFDSSGPVGKIIVQAPAQNKITATIKGKPAHAGIAPEKGVSAIMAGSDAISNMRLLRIDEETTANIGTFEAVGATNIVSPKARIIGEVRSLDREKIAVQTEHMEKCFRESAEKHGAEIEIEIEEMYDPYKFGDDEDNVIFVMEKLRSIGVDPYTASSGGGSDANVFNSKGIKAINIACGVNNAHTTDECIKVDELVKLTELVYGMITV